MSRVENCFKDVFAFAQTWFSKIKGNSVPYIVLHCTSIYTSAAAVERKKLMQLNSRVLNTVTSIVIYLGIKGDSLYFLVLQSSSNIVCSRDQGLAWETSNSAKLAEKLTFTLCA